MRPRQAADGAEFRAEGEEGVDDARDGGVECEGQPHAERGREQRLHQREAHDVRPGKAHEPDNAEHAALAPDGGDEVARRGCEEAHARRKADQAEHQRCGAVQHFDVFDFFGAGIDVDVPGAQKVPQRGHTVKVSGIEPERRVEPFAVSARRSRPAAFGYAHTVAVGFGVLGQ